MLHGSELHFSDLLSKCSDRLWSGEINIIGGSSSSIEKFHRQCFFQDHKTESEEKPMVRLHQVWKGTVKYTPLLESFPFDAPVISVGIVSKYYSLKGTYYRSFCCVMLT
jgi:hypothetical protein